ncbi:MAG TPA: hypothetical protein VF783_14515 [Terriglobales bacterium]
MPRHLAWAAVVLFFPVLASAQTQAPAKPQPHSPLIKPSTPGKAPWDFSLTVDRYLIEDGDDYAQPTFTADNKWLHLEAHYNYENFHTGSLWRGYIFTLLLASRSRGSGRLLGALYSGWLVGGVCLRRSLPICCLRSTDAPAGARMIGFTIPGMISSERSMSGAEDARAGVAIAGIARADFRVFDPVADASAFRLMAGSLYRG